MKRCTTLCCNLLLGLLLLACTPPWSGPPFVQPTVGVTNNPAQYVNPFVGTARGGPDYDIGNAYGNTFPGADTPFGMIQWSPDTDSPINGGYNYNSDTITGFSLTHLSGAGCSIYRDIPFMPYVGSVTASPGIFGSNYRSHFSHNNEQASPGYYSVQLTTSKVKAELTVTPRTGFGRFTYSSSKSSTMLINTAGSANGDIASFVQINSSKNQVTGSASSGAFCFINGPYTIYFAAQFDQPFTGFGTWKNFTVTPGSTSSSGFLSGAYVTFDTTSTAVVQVKVGVSFVSVQNALANLQTENSGWDFNSVKTAASTSWNILLNQIQVSGGTLADTQTFYTNFYHALLFPSLFSDGNGQYIGFDKKVHTLPPGHAQYANYSGWDMYRSQVALLALLVPDQVSDMMQSLVNDYKESGCLPKWALANYHTNVQDGDSADPIIAVAYAFGAANFDARTALQAMLKGATQDCSIGFLSSTYMERPGLAPYQANGYIPSNTLALIKGTASATLEYSNDDFAISQFAKALGDMHNYSIFSARAQNWQNLFNLRTGFIQPRNADGTFDSSFDPTSKAGFQEGNSYQYTWMVPYNLARLFTTMGGNQRVINRLNTFFIKLNAGPESQYAFLANEPGLSSPWDYDFAGQPWQTQSVVRRAITQLYNATPGGLSGNDDLGEMGSWYVWSSIGLYPMYPGVADLVLGSPLFPKITVTLGNRKQIQITGTGASDSALYVQSLSVNGQSSTQLWQPYSTLSNGATLAFTLGSSPNTSWGNKPSDVPPSFGA